MRLLACLVLLGLASCSSPSERWAEASFGGISYPSLYTAVLTTLDAEGFLVRERDPQTPELHSDWVYGTSQRNVRGPSRRRVHTEITDEGGEIWRVRVRVEEQVVRKGGMLATNVRESENWEDYEDNFDDAEYLMAKISALLEAHRRRAAAP